jgi:hypothetical protein
MPTELQDFIKFRSTVPHALELLNVHYLVRSNTAAEADPVYSDDYWKVYKNPSSPCPRAWIVHEAAVEPSFDRALLRIKNSDFDPLKVAIISGPLDTELEPKLEGAQEEVQFTSYQPNRLELTARAHSRALLVLSESHFPGWQAMVNGGKARIQKVDGVLRGVVIPSGESKVVFRYVPISVILGAVLTLLAFVGSCALCLFVWRSEREEAQHPGR